MKKWVIATSHAIRRALQLSATFFRPKPEQTIDDKAQQMILANANASRFPYYH